MGRVAKIERMKAQRSFVLKPKDAVKKWYLVDGKDWAVGRLASIIASLLRGKGNPKYTPHTDSGDFVLVINGAKVKLTGRKWKQKKYYHHSGFVGGLKEQRAEEALEKDPTFILRHAVKGMLPKNTLGRKQLKKLKIVPGDKHSHQGQKPIPLKVEQ